LLKVGVGLVAQTPQRVGFLKVGVGMVTQTQTVRVFLCDTTAHPQSPSPHTHLHSS